MNLTQKETELIKDLQNQEKLCIQKYDRYAGCVCSQELKNLFTSIAGVERTHLDSLNQLMAGTVVSVTPGKIEGSNNQNCGNAGYNDENCRKNDAFMCQDLLSTEKHASALYDTCVFEFTDPQARLLLNHIQAEEQQHGEKLYAYMNANQISI